MLVQYNVLGQSVLKTLITLYPYEYSLTIHTIIPDTNKSVLIPIHKGFLLDPFLRSVKNGPIKVLDDRFELVGDEINMKHLVIKNY
jgi:hypothetical protein